MPGGGQTGPPKLSRYDIDSANGQRVADLLAVSGPTTVARLLTLRTIGDVSESKLRRALTLLESVGRVRSTAPQERHGHRVWALVDAGDDNDDDEDSDPWLEDRPRRSSHAAAVPPRRAHLGTPKPGAWVIGEVARTTGRDLRPLLRDAQEAIDAGCAPAELVRGLLWDTPKSGTWDPIRRDFSCYGSVGISEDGNEYAAPCWAGADLFRGWARAYLRRCAKGERHPVEAPRAPDPDAGWSTDYSSHTEPTRQQREYARALEPADF